MYSRYSNDAKRPVRLPEHYSGSAFSQSPTEPVKIPQREPTKPFSREAIGEKVSPIADRMLRVETIEETINDVPSPKPAPPIVEQDEVEREESSMPSIEKKTLASPFNFEGLRRIFGGAGGDGEQDRLLLLGLILLLSRTEGDSDILLWLSLLLLCG